MDESSSSPVHRLSRADQLIRLALEASFRQPSPDTQTLINWLDSTQMRPRAWGRARDGSLTRSYCPLAPTGHISVEARKGPQNILIRSMKFIFWFIKLNFAWNPKWHCDDSVGVLWILKEFCLILTRSLVFYGDFNFGRENIQRNTKRRCEQSRQNVLSLRLSVSWTKVNRKEGRRRLTCFVSGRVILA